MLDRLRVAMTSPPGCAARAVISELDHERAAAFVGFMHERLVDPVKQLLREVFAAAEARGEIRPGSVTPAVVDVIPALMMYRSKLGGGEFTPQTPAPRWTRSFCPSSALIGRTRPDDAAA
ncbi:TetR-like C-terminal domain-containing protein [Streptacidiphilus monticola]